MILFGVVPDSFTFSVVIALVPLAQKIANRCRQFTDDASSQGNAPSKPQLEGPRVLALAAVRHD